VKTTNKYCEQENRTAATEEVDGTPAPYGQQKTDKNVSTGSRLAKDSEHRRPFKIWTDCVAEDGHRWTELVATSTVEIS